jgi:hypothetical protein
MSTPTVADQLIDVLRQALPPCTGSAAGRRDCAGAAHAQAETYTFVGNDRTTGLSFTCEEEAAVVTDGRSISASHTTVDATGGLHLITNSFYRSPGTGEETGDSFLSMRSSHFMLNNGAATTMHNGGHDLMIAQGPGDDASQYSSYHTTQNANGETTASVVQLRVEPCGDGG